MLREASVATESSISEKRSISVVKRSPRNINSFEEIPATTFSCAAQESPGIFADQETGCQVFHYCQPGGRVDSFFCPNLTLFNQQYFVCDWEYNVDCSLASKYFPLNHQLFESTPPLQIIPDIAATTQTDLLGAASSAEAIHSLNHIQGAHHVAHTAALLGNVETSINTNTFTGSSPVVPAQIRAALPSGALGVPAVLESVGPSHVAGVAPIAGSALALGGLTPASSHPLAQPVFHSALNLATGSLLHPEGGATSGQLSRAGKTSPDTAGSSSESYDDAVADPEPAPPSLATTPIPLLSDSSEAYDDAVADPEPYPGATPADLLAQGLPLAYKPSYSAQAAYDSADPEPTPQDNLKTISIQYIPSHSAKYSQYKAARLFDSADPEPAAYLTSNTIDLTSSADFDDSPADPEPDPSSYAVAASDVYSSVHPDPDSEPSADPEFTSY